MIKSLTLKPGRSAGSSSQNINLTPVTVFVGPNNSGKSLALREIYQYCSSGQQRWNSLIIKSLEFIENDDDKMYEAISKNTIKPRKEEQVPEGHLIIGKKNHRQQVSEETLKNALKYPENYRNQFCQWFLAMNTLMLDGQTRMNLVTDQPAGDLLHEGTNSLQILFRDDNKRAELRRIIFDAFGDYCVIDACNIGHLRYRLSKTEPPSNSIERGWDQQSVDFHNEATHIINLSDGVKAFTGIITEVIAGDPSVMLIDEPEAFLHPALSFKLGNEITRSTKDSEKRLIVSTHSPNFVMGCIHSGANINIIRLTYRNESSTARVLPSDKISELMRNPLLRSVGVISALFYEFVIVTESDADRAFYQEINERLNRFHPEWGIPNCLFLNAQNKQTIQTIIKPLRELGIPAIAIVDVDIFKEGGKVFTDFLSSGNIPQYTIDGLHITRQKIQASMTSSGKNMKIDGGIEILNTEAKEAAENLIQALNDYGLFIIPNGELEYWLKNLGATGHGPSWLINIFEKMGEDVNNSSYIKPSEDDVWKFMYQIKKWLVNPSRKGIPA